MGSLPEELLERLCAEDSSVREKAAELIYREGRRSSDGVLQEWRGNREFAALTGPELQATVGVAVPREIFTKIRAANGMPSLANVPPDQDAEEFELHFEDGVMLDVLTSRTPGGDGAIAKYLSKFGAGVQQVEYLCNEVTRAAEILKEEFGVKAVYEATRAGADGTRVNFFLVNGADGKVLVELVEKDKK